ncbi:2-hydroxyacid dehydrogenase [Rhodovulum marinum]|uniref:Lactate dehydrogenase-like 2-hydroxyacid dehydrogenase n=1 Tax=Rhodovulum marinum TaxID=320662 RepID=A0A4R2Q639_9RHOB|nr:2-hydroxyacid dehydrogenase [Rhodovulum marinum]TCP43298.1 lactate dehydrogenase-like 2-hydroxyacid dehydrogenase [Rhodovulum marinum]
MTGTTLAIGAYDADDLAALRDELGAAHVAGPDLLGGLDQATRAAVTAVAYSGQARFGAAQMDLLPRLGIVANYGVGYDAIDLAAARARGVAVTNTPGVLTDDVADLAVAMLLTQARGLVAADRFVRSGGWAGGGAWPLQRKIGGARAGILGLGRIGRAIATRLAAFGMEIHYHSRAPKQTPGWAFHADPVELARGVDFLVVALVGGPETAGYVSAAVIEALGPAGVLVNIARGSCVDETALLDALETGRLGGAALDVFRNEPDIDPRFHALSNVLLQPHQGSATHATRAAMARLQRDNIAAFHAGRPLPTPVV